MKNTKEILDFYLENFSNPPQVSIDMTCGNGNDSLNILLRFPKSQLFAFDIQEKARENTYKLFFDSNLSNLANFHFILDNHLNFKNYIKTNLDLVVYNLGYLPGGDKSICTKADEVLGSLKLALASLNEGGQIYITLYPGHESGLDETGKIQEYLKKVEQRQFNVIKHEFINQKNNPPLFIMIEKRKP